MAGSIFWAGLANTARVVTVAVGQARYGVDLSKGWQHDAIGLIAVVVALLMVVSSDRLLAFLLTPIVLPSDRPLLNPLSKTWNAWVGGKSEGQGAGSSEQGAGLADAELAPALRSPAEVSRPLLAGPDDRSCGQFSDPRNPAVRRAELCPLHN